MADNNDLKNLTYTELLDVLNELENNIESIKQQFACIFPIDHIIFDESNGLRIIQGNDLIKLEEFLLSTDRIKKFDNYFSIGKIFSKEDAFSYIKEYVIRYQKLYNRHFAVWAERRFRVEGESYKLTREILLNIDWEQPDKDRIRHGQLIEITRQIYENMLNSGQLNPKLNETRSKKELSTPIFNYMREIYAIEDIKLYTISDYLRKEYKVKESRINDTSQYSVIAINRKKKKG